VDIYMPDFKYGRDREAFSYSGIERYTENCMASISEMHRQVGNLESGADGTARKGLLVRHLVLPNGIAGSKKVIDFLVSEISPATVLNIMDQYRPAFKALEYPALARRATRAEIDAVIDYARRRGMSKLLQ
jgi:putative pyruvate formate lyase activating enzyme